MRVAWQLALLWVSAQRLARAGFSEIFQEHLRKLPYTCAIPLEEGERLERTTLGSLLFGTGLNLVDQLPSVIRVGATTWCEQTIPPDPPPEVNRTFYVETCVRVLTEATSTIIFDRLMECDEEGVQELCGHTSPGNFCLISRDSTRTCALTTFNQSVRRPFEVQCIQGFYCSGGSNSAMVCRKGTHCPDGAIAPAQCTPGHTCLIASHEIRCDGNVDPLLHGTRCDFFGYDNRILLPDVCRRRNYCDGGQIIPCPDGHFCPEATANPLPCTDVEECSKGAYFPSRYTGAVLLSAWWLMQFVLLMVVFSMDLFGHLWQLQLLFLLSSWLVFLYQEFGTSHAIFIAWSGWHMLWIVALCPALKHAYSLRGWMIVCLDMLASFGPLGLLGYFYHQPYAVGLMAILWPSFLVSTSILGSHGGGIWTQSTIVLIGLAALVTFDLTFFDRSAFVVLIFSLVLFLLPQVPVRLWESFLAMRRLSPSQAMGGFQSNARVPEIMLKEQTRRQTRDLTNSVLNLRKVLSGLSMPGEPYIELDKLSAPTNSRGQELSRSGAPEATPSVGKSLTDGVSQSVSKGVYAAPSVSGSPSVNSRLRSDLYPKVGPKVTDRSSNLASSNLGSPAICLALEDMSLLLRSGKVILNPMSLVIPPACAVAVMGPSGSGKSSITNVLSGRAGYGIICGTIRVNGRCNIDVRDLRAITAFVPQEDMMHRNLTCLENVAFQAKLRLPPSKRQFSGLKWAEKEAATLLQSIGLGHVQDQRIGDESSRGISGGQRKRVSIAMELISKPSLLFLDEPTTGLDSTTSQAVVEMVTSYAHEHSCTTAAVVHQPRFETVQKFDHIILLATGGYLVYSGPVPTAVQYFVEELGVAFDDEANPADVLMDATCLETAAEMVKQGTMDVREMYLQDNDIFGQHLQEHWQETCEMYSSSARQMGAVRGLPDLDPKSNGGSVGGDEGLAQFRRAALQLGRSMQHHLMMNGLLMGGVGMISYSMDAQIWTMQIFFHVSITLLFLMLAAGVSAQRTFGGAERFVAWREAGVSINMIHYWVGRDLASLVEVGFMATVFSMIYWCLGPLFISFSTLFWTIFAFIYAVYGYGFLWSVFLESSQAQMVSIMTSFVFFFMCGVQPPFANMVEAGNGELIHLMALSPIRWAQGYLQWEHVIGGEDAQFRNPLYLLEQEYVLDSYGVALNQNFTCDRSDTIRDRWMGNAWGKPVSLNCSNMQLYLLGLILRAAGACSLVAISKMQSSGGGALFEGRGQSLCSEICVPLLNLLFWAFLIVLFNCELNLMLQTH